MNQAAILLAVASALFAATAGATTYKWVDENGRTQYSDKPPMPQNAKSAPTEMNRRGIVTKDPQAEKAEEAARAQGAPEEQRMLEQRRRDNALLKTYTKPEEVDLLRDRSLEGIDAEIKSYQLRRKVTEQRLNDRYKRFGALEKAKKPIPPELQNDIAHDQDELKRIDEQIKGKDNEKVNIRMKAEQDKQRFIELRAGKK